jgi:predicted DNA-binding transcriptional regulator YafY
MPTGKNASYRYRIINQCLKNKHRQWIFEELRQYIGERLWEEFDVDKGVSVRQLNDDIRIMRKGPPEGYGAPIKRSGGYIYYTDPDFSIDSNPLNQDDLENLDEVLRLLKPFESLPQLRAVSSVLSKLKGTAASKIDEGIIQIEHNTLAEGLSSPLYNLIKEEYQIELRYRPFAAEQAMSLVINPYVIKEYNNRWFLLAWNPEIERFSSYALDRVVGYSSTKEPVLKEKKEELRSITENIIGVSINGTETQKVVFHCSPKLAPYFITKPLHRSQKQAEIPDSDWTKFTIQVIPNIELRAELLRFGADVKVVAPEWLVEEMRGVVGDMKYLYIY